MKTVDVQTLKICALKYRPMNLRLKGKLQKNKELNKDIKLKRKKKFIYNFIKV